MFALCTLSYDIPSTLVKVFVFSSVFLCHQNNWKELHVWVDFYRIGEWTREELVTFWKWSRTYRYSGYRRHRMFVIPVTVGLHSDWSHCAWLWVAVLVQWSVLIMYFTNMHRSTACQIWVWCDRGMCSTKFPVIYMYGSCIVLMYY